MHMIPSSLITWVLAVVVTLHGLGTEVRSETVVARSYVIRLDEPQPSPSPTPPPPPPSVDRLVENSWYEARVAPAAVAPAGIWLRRVTLDLVGELPTSSQRQLLVKDDCSETRERLVDDLLGRPAFAHRWGRLLSEGLVSATTASARIQESATRHFVDGLKRPSSLDVIVRQFLTATGAVDRSPASRFLHGHLGNPGGVAARISAGLLGVRADCLQCHDDPHGRWSRADLKELGAWFTGLSAVELPPDLYQACAEAHRGKVRQLDIMIPEGKRSPAETAKVSRLIASLLSLQRSLGSSGPTATGGGSSRERTLAATSTPSADVPRVPVRSVNMSGSVSVLLEGPIGAGRRLDSRAPPHVPLSRGHRTRTELATWVTRPTNPLFARAMANRVWAALFGRGVVEPVDDVVAPSDLAVKAILDGLTRDLVDLKFDVAKLVRRIVLSRTYARAPTGGQPVDGWRFQAAVSRELDHAQIEQSLWAGLGTSAEAPSMGAPAASTGSSPPTTASAVTVDSPLERALARSSVISKLAGRTRSEACSQLCESLLCRAPRPLEHEQWLSAGGTELATHQWLMDLARTLCTSREFLTNH